MKLKTVVPLTDPSVLTGAAREFYDESTFRKEWEWYVVDGHLYIIDRYDEDDKEEKLLKPFELYMDGEGSPHSFVRLNGEYVFECRCTGSYETSVISPIDGKSFVVHDG